MFLPNFELYAWSFIDSRSSFVINLDAIKVDCDKLVVILTIHSATPNLLSFMQLVPGGSPDPEWASWPCYLYTFVF